MPYLLAFDIPGIQKYVYATGRLRQIIGGSAIIDYFNRALIDYAWDEQGSTTIYSGGGNGKILCQSQETLQTAIRLLTQRAYQAGLNICCASVQCGHEVSWEDLQQKLDDALAEKKRSAPLRSFALRHPLAAACSTCGRGSAAYEMEQANRWLCPVCDLKEKVGKDSRKIATVLPWGPNYDPILDILGLQGMDPNRVLLKDLQEVEAAKKAYYQKMWDGGEWSDNSRIAVVCMDGNGMGAAVRRLERVQKNKAPCEALREFSQALDKVTRAAFSEAFRKVFGERQKIQQDVHEGMPLPFRPILVGGDDVTFLIAPELAWQFVITLVDAFARCAGEKAAQGLQGMTISAGILITHANYPLSESLHLAEEILSAAKQKGRALRVAENPIPACVDYEVFLDSLSDPLATRRARTKECQIDAHTIRKLYCRPYVVSQESARLSQLNGVKTMEALLAEAHELKSSDLPRSKRKKLREVFALDEVGVGLEMDVVLRKLHKPAELTQKLGLSKENYVPAEIPVMDYLDMIDHLGGKRGCK